jgi:hyperosmotically inducible protein
MQYRQPTARLTGALLLIVALAACSPTRTQQSAGEVIDDSVVTAKVKTALIEDPVTKAHDIDVETYRGVVQLGGFVDSAAQKSRASEVARTVAGVTEVRNDLRVSEADQTVARVVDDSAITAQVKAKLIADSPGDAQQINVETRGGVVQLTGFVDSSEVRGRAAELARGVDGVREVRNDLELRQSR